MKVVVYVRVSTEEQAKKGCSIAAQVDKCLAYAELYELEVVDTVIDDGYSAKSLNRPGWQRVEEMLRTKEVGGVVVIALDRMTRKLRDFMSLSERFFKKDYALHCVTERVDTGSANGRLVLHILMSVAEWELDEISERTSRCLQSKKAAGKVWGQIPYGYMLASDGESVIPNKPEQDAISIMRALSDQGVSERGIVKRLDLLSIAPRGSKWHRTTVSRILKRDMKVGEHCGTV